MSATNFRDYDRDQALRATLESLFGSVWEGSTIPQEDGEPALRAWYELGVKHMLEIPEEQLANLPDQRDRYARTFLLQALERLRGIVELSIYRSISFSRRDIVGILSSTRSSHLVGKFVNVQYASFPAVGSILGVGEESERVDLPAPVNDRVCWLGLKRFFSRGLCEKPFPEFYCEAVNELRTTLLSAEMGS